MTIQESCLLPFQADRPLNTVARDKGAPLQLKMQLIALLFAEMNSGHIFCKRFNPRLAGGVDSKGSIENGLELPRHNDVVANDLQLEQVRTLIKSSSPVTVIAAEQIPTVRP